ncbi:M56 family metallopeptidase [Acidicapsa acidisoli]|uniref:M56 family metallopeptidase n=1 Tax=Acidicapsa acidisoli TaxID=1615681 RepID=UPI0021E0EF48|nr:M56 family metallopeptidase [Acidicapsa acidisoli]
MNPARAILFDLLFNACVQIALFAIVAAALSCLIAKARAKYQYLLYLLVLLVSLVAPAVNTLWHRHSTGAAEGLALQISSRGAARNYEPWILRDSLEQHQSFLTSPGIQSLMIGAWAVLVFFRLTRFCRAVRRVRRLRREALVLSSGDLGVASQIFESRHRVALLKSAAIDDPVTIGAFHPAIVLPSKLLPCLAYQDLSVILAHEYGHVRRRDFMFHVACELISLPVSWHPGTNYLLSKISHTRELACDDYAATRLGKRRFYANTLVRLASLSLHTSRGNAIAMGLFDGDNLEARIGALTENRVQLSRAALSGLILATSIAMSVGAVLAHAMSLQTSSDLSAPGEKFAGTWHWMFQGRSFATMTLVRSGTNYTGSATQSRIALKRDGTLLRADPSDDTTPKQITRATPEGASLHVTVEDGFQFILTEKDGSRAEIHPVGAPPNMKSIAAEKVR